MYEQGLSADLKSGNITIYIKSKVGRFDAIKIVPEKQVEGTPPVIMVGGWSTNKTAYLDPLREIAEGGYTCWSPGRIDKTSKIADNETLRNLPQVEL